MAILAEYVSPKDKAFGAVEMIRSILPVFLGFLGVAVFEHEMQG